jgi:hypothetical protein
MKIVEKLSADAVLPLDQIAPKLVRLFSGDRS